MHMAQHLQTKLAIILKEEIAMFEKYQFKISCNKKHFQNQLNCINFQNEQLHKTLNFLIF